MSYCTLMFIILLILKLSKVLDWDWIWILSPVLIFLGAETILDMIARFHKSIQPKSFLQQLGDLNSKSSNSKVEKEK